MITINDDKLQKTFPTPDSKPDSIIYVGPESLKNIVEKVYSEISHNFSIKVPCIDISLDNVFAEYNEKSGSTSSKSYPDLGYPDKESYLNNIDSRINELSELQNLREELMQKRKEKRDSEKNEFFKKANTETIRIEERFEAYKKYLDDSNTYTPEEERLYETHISKKRELRKISDFDEVIASLTCLKSPNGTQSDDEINEIIPVSGAHYTLNECLSFTPFYVFETKTDQYTAIKFKGSLAHELTHRELGNTAADELIRKYYGLYKKYQIKEAELTGSETEKTLNDFLKTPEGKSISSAFLINASNRREFAKRRGISDELINFLEEKLETSKYLHAIQDEIGRIKVKQKRAKTPVISECLAQAFGNEHKIVDLKKNGEEYVLNYGTSSSVAEFMTSLINEGPDFSTYSLKNGVSIDEYKTTYKIFRELLSKKPFGEVVDLARDVMNKAYAENGDAVQMFCESFKSK